METESTTSSDAIPAQRADPIQVVAAIAAALMVVVLVPVLLVQVEVTDAEVSVTRACGSAFDGAIDRSGWEQWWAADLDEPDRIRSALVRTTQCPEAVNRRLALATMVAITAVIAGAVAIMRTTAVRSTRMAASPIGSRVERIGRLTAALGGTLTILGIVAIVILVADADSTLFLYTDRLVVAVVGLIVLIPTVTLFVIGRVLVLVGATVQPSERDRSNG